MASVEDIHNFGDQFQYQLEKLNETDIDERDREAIREFIRYQDTQRDLAVSTNVNNCSDLRLSAERADTPLVEMERSDVDALLFQYKHDREMAEGTLRNYRKALRKFFRYRGCDWAEEIEIGSIPDREVDQDKVLSQDEVDRLREAADHPRNKALLEMLLDTGLRVSAIGTLRVGDVELGGRAGTVTLNQEAAGRKGASGKRPLTWSKPYVANWLDVHPRADTPGAPLFHRLTKPNGGWDDEDDGALSYYHLQRVLKQIAEEARTILERVEENIHGIDINPFAVHITQINLLFRTVDLYDKVTEQDPDYTMSGFNIHVADTLTPTVLEKQEGNTESDTSQSQIQEFAEYNGRAESFLDDRDAVDRIKDEVEFDVVVANPPYVRTQNINGPKGEYAERYTTVDNKSFDIYVPFIERGLEWLDDEGRLAYICPNRLLTNEYAEDIRERLVEEPLDTIIDFKDVEVFDAATPYPCIVTVDREGVSNEKAIRCARFAEERDGILEEIFRRDEWDASGTGAYDLFTYPRDRLVEGNRDAHLSSWPLMPRAERNVYDEIEEAVDFRLGEVTDSVFQGLITGWNKVFVGEIIGEADEEGVVQFVREGGEEPEPIEKSRLRRLLKGSEIDHWGAEWEGLWLIWPYEVEDGNATSSPERRWTASTRIFGTSSRTTMTS